jgi:hypothetical protein
MSFIKLASRPDIEPDFRAKLSLNLGCITKYTNTTLDILPHVLVILSSPLLRERKPHVVRFSPVISAPVTDG